ncbi:hypothetical protein PENTCL1PPCAC_1092 [Pristionchus entomophagus]|uniref:CX domain-containing protein n=1 Tax=Pristionchus entomophagus TaxID=358040 RepID=A0AAV5S9H6_9BILA|nr:hypothetical protein PENTCL1PPCAC_1092 [Pristionchus entomophagus]
MGVPFDLLSSTREHQESVAVPRVSSDSIFWSTTAFDAVPSFLTAQLRSVRLLARPHQSYYVYDGNATILEARTCSMSVGPSEMYDRFHSSSSSSSSSLPDDTNVIYFCSRWCCEPDCCQINASVWLIAFFLLCSLLLYLIHFCADDYRRRELMRRVFKNYRPVRRSNALREKKNSATRPKWRETPKISIDPPTPSITIMLDKENETSFNFINNDIIL